MKIHRQMLRAAAIAVLGVSLTTGIAAAATGDISNTGADSYNKVKNKTHVTHDITNSLGASVVNSNTQTANSGNAKAKKNTTGTGGVTTGMTSNDNTGGATLTLNQSAATTAALATPIDTSNDAGTIDTTGADSTNIVSNKTKVDTTVSNTVSLNVTNTSTQTASSGNATANKNTTVGDVTSGDSSNTNASTVTIDVTQ